VPDGLAENLILLVRQNHDSLPQMCWSHEFTKVTEEEGAALESIIREEFEDFENDDAALESSRSVGYRRYRFWTRRRSKGGGWDRDELA
jgi:hypothetical protein